MKKAILLTFLMCYIKILLLNAWKKWKGLLYEWDWRAKPPPGNSQYEKPCKEESKEVKNNIFNNIAQYEMHIANKNCDKFTHATFIRECTDHEFLIT